MLDYVALGILIFAGITLFYGIIVIHDIPYEIAVHRNHPHQDAIHYAGWVSLFTLHAIWPFLWIWSTLYREDRGWGFDQNKGISAAESEAAEADITIPEAAEAAESEVVKPESIAVIHHKLEALDDRIGRIEQAILAASETGTTDRDQG
ncbi:MAG: DUF3302 domain-containing protein [Gammaproteobacteria bacterium]|nr:DUF3302 domain-containing protein [Gammaproteobacteria bacterium]